MPSIGHAAMACSRMTIWLILRAISSTLSSRRALADLTFGLREVGTGQAKRPFAP